jgi:ectoine hydroxylase-related dioxygenase (phytanoyl-CoA dioxygenase family)
MRGTWRNVTEDKGFAIIPDVLADKDILDLGEAIARSTLPRNRAGLRHVLREPAVAALAQDSRLLFIAEDILGESAIPFRATFFDKSPKSNWLVVWHQDTALPLRERREVEGWGPWSIKEGINYAHAPASALGKVIALRIHVDDSTVENGPLRALPGTHSAGVLSDEEVRRVANQVTPIDCLVARGGVVAMRPLIVHSSSKSLTAGPRRVVHVEYTTSLDVEGGLSLAIA